MVNGACKKKGSTDNYRLKWLKTTEKCKVARKKARKDYYERGQMFGIFSHVRWSKLEDKIILNSKNTDWQIAAKIFRSVKAIQQRRVRLKQLNDEVKRTNTNDYAMQKA